MSIESVVFFGVRTEAFEQTVSLYRDIFALELFSQGPNHAWFRLRDGAELHVYGPNDEDHLFFGTAPCTGFLVSDFAATRSAMIDAGIEFIGEVQSSEEATWNHYRGPDGNVYEIMSRP